MPCSWKPSDSSASASAPTPEADAQRARIARPAQAGDREQQDREAREQRLLGHGVQRVAHARRRAAPDEARLRRGHEHPQRPGVPRHRDLRALGLRVRVEHAHVRAREDERDGGEQQAAERSWRRSAGAGSRPARPATTRSPRPVPAGAAGSASWRPRLKPSAICQDATAKPPTIIPGRSRRQPRSSRNSAIGIPPLESTCRCPPCSSRHGAQANAAPATAAAHGGAPSSRASRYAPRNASANASRNSRS